jgi:hypothetical protein
MKAISISPELAVFIANKERSLFLDDPNAWYQPP